MMMVPRLFNDNLFDSWFDDDFFWPEFRREAQKPEKKLYGHRAAAIMKTDVKDTGKNYEFTIDMPGIKIEDVKAELKDGYLTVSAESNYSNDDKDSDGTYIRRERHYGSCSRSFYVGEDVEQDDVKASFENGTLKLSVPKKDEQKKIEPNHYIRIE